MRNLKQISDTPKIERDDSLKIEVKLHPFSFKEDSDNPLNERIVEALNMMGGVGEEAETKYQAALNDLRKQSAKVSRIVAAEYKNLPDDQYLDRWSLVQLLAELKDSSSLEVLDDLLSSRIPAERSKDPHSFSTVGEEIMIRTTAVEALTRIADNKNEKALEILLKHTQHKNFSVKRAAIQGYLAHGGKDASNTLAKALPKNDQYILNIRRMDVREAPQAEGGVFLVNKDAGELPPPQLLEKDKG